MPAELGFLLGARSRLKARKLTNKANDLERKRRTITNIAARRAALASLRRQQASVKALGIGSGLIDGGSASSNAASNIDAQATTQIANQQQLSDIDLDRNRALEAADSRNRQANRFDAVAKLGFQAGVTLLTGGTGTAATGGLDISGLTK